MHTSHLLVLLPVFAPISFHNSSSQHLLPRQFVCDEPTPIECGTGCIATTDVCCPDGSGGCPVASEICWLGSNGEYGCCPIGETCEGPGGTIIEGGSCPSDQITCGTGCIPSTETCCPDGLEGCLTASEQCWLGSNGVYGCCPLGETCEGPGGSVPFTTSAAAAPSSTVFTNFASSTVALPTATPTLPNSLAAESSAAAAASSSFAAMESSLEASISAFTASVASSASSFEASSVSAETSSAAQGFGTSAATATAGLTSGVSPLRPTAGMMSFAIVALTMSLLFVL